MTAIYLLVPMALILVILIIVVFFWAVRSDQFGDLEGPAHRILFDDDGPGNEQIDPHPDDNPDEEKQA